MQPWLTEIPVQKIRIDTEECVIHRQALDPGNLASL